MIAAIIVIPSLILAGLGFWFLPTDYMWVSVVPLSVGVGTFIIRQGINEWWYSKFPPRLARVEQDILMKFFPYYRHLSAELKVEFEKRVAVFRLQKLFQMRGIDKIPGDVQLLVCASGIQMTMGFGYEREFFRRLTTIILFPRTFITPEINERLHAVEVNEGKVFDCLLLAVNTLIEGLQKPHQYYNIAIYGFAKAYRLAHRLAVEDIPCGDLKETLARLHVMRGFEIGQIFPYTGLLDFELFELLTEHFFCFPAQLREQMPAVYDYMCQTWGQDPCNAAYPVLAATAAKAESGKVGGGGGA